MDYRKFGMAFCIGLNQEAKLIEEYFSKFFEVDSVYCKVCGVEKENLSLEQIKAGTRQTMCNPLMQVKILKENNVKNRMSFYE